MIMRIFDSFQQFFIICNILNIFNILIINYAIL